MTTLTQNAVSPLVIEAISSLLHERMGSIVGERQSHPSKDHLQRQIACYENTLQTVHNVMSTDAAALKRELNALQPIYKLPTELLIDILLLDIRSSLSDPRTGNARRSRSATPPPPRQVQLASVAKDWDLLIHQTPQLWSDICFGAAATHTLLSHSKSARLNIVCDTSRPTPRSRERPQFPLAFLTSTSRQAHRWQSLKVIADSRPVIGSWMDVKAPGLRDLTFVMATEAEFVPPLAIGIGSSLRDLYLSGISIPWDQYNLSNLRSLQLSQIKTNAPSLETIRRILLSSPDIERLALDELHGITSPLDMPTEQLRLPRLRSLVLGNIASPMFQYLYFNIQPSPYCASYIHYASIGDFSTSPQSPLMKLVAPMLRTASAISIFNDYQAEEIEIHTHPRLPRSTWRPWTEVDARSDHESGAVIRVKTGGHGAAALKAATRWLQASGAMAKVHFWVNGRRSRSSLGPPSAEPFPIEALDALHSQVETLNIKDLQHASSILSYLAQRMSTTGVWPCPNLTSLDLTSVFDLSEEALKDFKISRWNTEDVVATDSATTSGEGRPPKLSKLELPWRLAQAREAPFAAETWGSPRMNPVSSDATWITPGAQSWGANYEPLYGAVGWGS